MNNTHREINCNLKLNLQFMHYTLKRKGNKLILHYCMLIHKTTKQEKKSFGIVVQVTHGNSFQIVIKKA